MTQEEIKEQYQNLSSALKDALSRMELTDRIFTIKQEINSLQQLCPHSNEFSQQGKCPYCGKRMG